MRKFVEQFLLEKIFLMQVELKNTNEHGDETNKQFDGLYSCRSYVNIFIIAFSEKMVTEYPTFIREATNGK